MYPTAKPACCLTSVLLATLAAGAAGQTPVPQATPSALPTDPAALLELAHQVNGFHDPGLKPWHIRATWQTLDDQQHVTDQGTWEEWWAGEKKYKIAYKSADVDRISYGTDHGTWLVKNTDKVAWQFGTVERLIQGPVQIVRVVPPITLDSRELTIQQGSASLLCVVQNELREDGEPVKVMAANGTARPLELRYCFSGDLPAIRAEAISDGGQTVFNSLIRFQGQYLAQKIRSFGASGIETDISLDLVEPLDPVVDADFAPPTNAKPISNFKKIAVSSGIAQRNRISGRPPEYPADARAAHVQGTVVLQATISEEGSITSLDVISGPPRLQQAAIDAVRTWRYRPYLLNGVPVAVETQVNIVFSL